MSSRGREVSRQLFNRAMAIELANTGVTMPVLELSVPGELQRTVHQMTRGMTRSDALALVAHMMMLVRLFAAEVPVGRRDQMLAELDDFDAALDQAEG